MMQVARPISHNPGPFAEPVMLDDKESGALRRMLELANRLPDDWSGMMGRSTLQEDNISLRFQLAYMVYALAVAHIQRLPAASGYFRESMAKLVVKLTSPDVWSYWHFVSTGNGDLSKALGELPPRWDPIEKDNIMYSAYLHSSALIFHHVFDDDRFAKENALTLAVKPLFWGGGPKVFHYDERRLNDHLYWTMVNNGYIGIACEPNCIFQICNQPAIIGYRMHDMIYGTSIARDVTEGYRQAWQEFGELDADGHYHVVVQEKEHALVPMPPHPWTDFWMGSLTHAWNNEAAEARYAAQKKAWLRDGPDGTLWVEPSMLPVEQAQELTNALDLGWAAVCAAEMGDLETRDRLLAYADRFLSPVFEKGAYYYPRRDDWVDADGNFCAMDPHTGNVLLNWARLNDGGGLRNLFTGERLMKIKQQPQLLEIPSGISLRAACYDETAAALHVRWQPDGRMESLRFTAGNFSGGNGRWTLIVDGQAVAAGTGLGPDRDGPYASHGPQGLVLNVPARSGGFSIQWLSHA